MTIAKLGEAQCYANLLNLYGHLSADEYAQIDRKLEHIYKHDDQDNELDQLHKEIVDLYFKLCA